MANTKSGKKRTQVKDLPKKEKKLKADEMKKVKGGVRDILIYKSTTTGGTEGGGSGR